MFGTPRCIKRETDIAERPVNREAPEPLVILRLADDFAPFSPDPSLQTETFRHGIRRSGKLPVILVVAERNVTVQCAVEDDGGRAHACCLLEMVGDPVSGTTGPGMGILPDRPVDAVTDRFGIAS